MKPSRTIPESLCFDDILLVPSGSSVESRADVDLSMDIGWANLSCPIISAPMDTVTESAMVLAMAQAGGLGIIHRYNSIEEQCQMVVDVWNEYPVAIGAAVGAKGDYLERAEALVDSGASAILVDTANGHSDYAVNAVKQLRSQHSDIYIMGGNVATADGYVQLALAGANSVRVGIGGGSVCTTREVSGHGVPTLQSIIDCEEAKWGIGSLDNRPAIIADGGIRNSGDAVKAFAAGADAVMLGSMLAGTDETPGEVIDGRKRYRGMASSDAQQDWRGVSRGSEGISTTAPLRGTVRDVLADICRGIQSGCSYSGVDRLDSLAAAARYTRVSGASLMETRPHAKEIV